MTSANLVPIPELYVSADSAAKLKLEAADLPSWDLTPRQICDLELLMNGGFNPLKGFLTEADYDGVVDDMRLADGTLWPMPITLDVSEAFAGKVEPGQDIALRDQEGVILAIMSVTDKWSPDKSVEAEQVFGADDIAHPAVNYLHHKAGPVYLGGPITGIQQPVHYDFRSRAQHAERAARLLPQARLAPDRRLPDPQPAAPRAPGADLPRRARGAGEPADPPGRRHDQARRHRPLHPGALLRGGARPVSGLDHDAVAAQPRDAHGRPARGGLARHHPPQPRLHPHDRRPRPCRPGQEQPGQGLLRPLRRPGAVRQAPGRDRRRDGRLQADGLRPGEGPVRAARRGRGGPDHPRHLRHRAAPPPAGRPRHPRLVLLPGGGRGAAPVEAAAGAARASPCSSPASPARASRRSPTR